MPRPLQPLHPAKHVDPGILQRLPGKPFSLLAPMKKGPFPLQYYLFPPGRQWGEALIPLQEKRYFYIRRWACGRRENGWRRFLIRSGGSHPFSGPCPQGRIRIGFGIRRVLLQPAECPHAATSPLTYLAKSPMYCLKTGFFITHLTGVKGRTSCLPRPVQRKYTSPATRRPLCIEGKRGSGHS